MSNKPPHGLRGTPSLLENDNRLRGILRKALAEALAPTLGVSLGVMAACGDGALDPVTPGPIERGGICAQAKDTLGCTPGGLTPAFNLLTPAQPVDDWMAGVGHPTQEQLDSACATATNRQECHALVDAAVKKVVPETPPCDQLGCTPATRYVATRSGNEVRVFTTSEQLAKLLAPIETAAEADFVARFFSNFEMNCSDKRMGVWCAGDSFSVVSFNQTCSTFDFVLKVTVPHDGSAPVTDELERKKTGCAIGRLPDNCMVRQEGSARWDTVSAFLTECAALEAASVPAFMLLAEDLRALNAPSDLIEAALRSAADETRHAMMVSGLVQSDGGTRSLCVEVPARVAKSLFDMALENAVEGCVRETYGALVGAYQAVTAKDTHIQATISQLVQDEIAHASLSHAISQWAYPQLLEEQRAQIAASQRLVIASLRKAAYETHATDLYSEAGYPETAVALRMLDVLESSLWNDDEVVAAEAL